MVFRQLFEPLSSTYTYLIACEDSGEAVLIDPVYPTWERDLALVRSLGLKLLYTVETHVHADHITSALRLKQEVGSKIAFPCYSQCECTDIVVEEGKPLRVGGLSIQPVYTPGHTDDHFCYKLGDRVLTGDALLIDGCGRTDFQNGNATTLYHSVQDKLFSLPEDTLVYPAHDYNLHRVSTIAQEKTRNPRLGDGKSLDEFLSIMEGLNLPYPKFIDYAIPGNRQCGVCPEDLPEKMEAYCAEMALSLQG